MSKIKVVHLLQSPRFSGAENVVCQIIRMFQRDETIEMIYCSPNGPIKEALVERKINFLPITDLTVKEVRRMIREVNPDIIHAHDMRASFVAAQACKTTRLISHIHNNSFDSRGISMKAIAFLRAGIRSKHIYWVSDSAYKGYKFHKFLAKKSEVLYNIINIEDLYNKMLLDDRAYNYDIVYLGRLSRPKNPIRLMKVFRGIVDKIPSVKIAVIGTGELNEETMAEASRLQLNENVTFLGFQNNPYKILHDARVMIMTSLWEGTPMCVLEAMSLGTPVVSTPTDGVKVVVENGKTGLLSESNQGLVDACCKIIEEDSFYEKLSNASIERARGLMDTDTYYEKIKKSYMI